MKKRNSKISREELGSLHADRQMVIRARLDEFSQIPPSEYFYELVYCLLTPQSSAENAGRVVELLRELDFMHSPIDPEPCLRRKDFYIRFHKTKAKHLMRVREQFHILAPPLQNGRPGGELREWLVENVRGLGWKEASHFLRNIGYRNLAILDRHILRNLIRLGIIRRLPKSLTPKRYRAIENKFRIFAGQIRIPMDELDLLFWSMETGKILK